MAQLLLLQSPTEPIRSGDKVPDILKKCAGLLDPLSTTAPGVIDAHYLLARVKYLAGERRGSVLDKKCTHALHTSTHTHTNTHAQTSTHTHKHTHTQMSTHTHKHTHTNVHTSMHVCTTYIHTYSLLSYVLYMCPYMHWPPQVRWRPPNRCCRSALTTTRGSLRRTSCWPKCTSTRVTSASAHRSWSWD